MFLVPEDFTGFYQIASNCFDKGKVQSYIDKYELFYLQRLLGCELYEDFVADLNSDTPPRPQSQRFIDIFDPLCIESRCFGGIYVPGYARFEDDDCRCYDHDHEEQLQSQGIPDMLKGLIYWHYVRDQPYQNTTTGTRVNRNDVSREPSNAEKMGDLAERWNDGQSSFAAIREYIFQNLGDYNNYKGVHLAPLAMGGAF